MNYFNTTDLADVEQFEQIAGVQNRAVLRFYMSRTGQELAPSAVHESLIQLGLIDKKTPITSIRRSISQLTDRGFLRKSAHRVLGPYGRPEFTWSFKSTTVTYLYCASHATLIKHSDKKELAGTGGYCSLPDCYRPPLFRIERSIANA